MICFLQFPDYEKCELKILKNHFSTFCPVPIYLKVKLDRSLTFRHYRLALSKKLLLRRLAGTGLVLVPKHHIQPSYLSSTRQLSTAIPFVVAEYMQ